jgi:hypothetical protein
VVTPLSTQYFEYLNSVSSNESFLFNQPPQGWESSTVGDKNDKILCDCIARSNLILDLGIDIPQLRQAAENSYISKQKTQLYKTIYTAETFKDYHTLLCTLISEYAKSLENLMGCPSSKKKNLTRVLRLGHTLYRMVNGSTTECHLQNINSLLLGADRRGENMQKDKDTNTDEDAQLLVDEDADLETKVTATDDRSESPIQLWKLYGNWLKLIVAQFSAAETLTSFVRSPRFSKVFNDISVKILISPFVPVKALRLTTLLTEQKLFPVGSGMPFAVTNRDLLDFLDLVQPLMGALVELEKFVHSVKIAKTAEKLRSSVDKAIAALDTWPERFPKLPKWQGYGEELKEYFLVLKDHSAGPLRVEKITKRLAELKKSAQIFALMKQDVTTEMADTVGHCEASLASLLMLSLGDFGGKYDKVIRELQVNFVIFSHCWAVIYAYFKGFRPHYWSLATFLPNML